MATTKVSTDVIDMSGNTGGLTWVKGTTGEQPAGALGELRVNTTTKKTQIYTDVTGTSEWQNLKESTATFGVDFLVVAGGGAGVSNAGQGGVGGGGAGGLRTSYGSSSGGGASNENTLQISINTDYNVTVGEGGTAGTAGAETNGDDSQFATIISIGGGIGGIGSGQGQTGGSGGGSGRNFTSAGGAGTQLQGFSGGAGGAIQSTPVINSGNGGGGGGASAAGSAGNNSGGGGGAGGAGLEVNIVGGTGNIYAGGGGGGSTVGPAGSGGSGGGANGSVGDTNASAGTANTGGGGGGCGGNALGGAGGSGFVVLRYPDSFTLTVGTGSLTTGQLNTAVGTDEKYTTFTGGTGKISFS